MGGKLLKEVIILKICVAWSGVKTVSDRMFLDSGFLHEI